MGYKFFIVLVSILIGKNTFSQHDSASIARNHIFLEAAGAGGYGSVNYERVIYNKKDLMFAMRFGLSTYHIKDFTNKINPDILIPFGINGYYGRIHKIEAGVGESYTNIVHSDLVDFKSNRKTNFHTVLSIGYRYQKNSGGIVFRCAYTPIIEFNRTLRHWAGVSFGYSF